MARDPMQPALSTATSTPVSLADAYAFCERLARTHYENFPVASRLLPRAMRPHVAAVYAFARRADDFADETERPPHERHRLLDRWLQELGACAAGREPGEPELGSSRAIFTALGATIRSRRLPVSLFEDLVSAFRQDITMTRYATWAEVLDYCRRSANPVGRLVLRIAGCASEPLDRASDALCTGLQLANFWQDLAIDWRRGRLYVPREDCDVCCAPEADLNAGRMTDAWQCALRRVTERTRKAFAEGRAVCDGVTGRLRWELRLTWLGGTTILDRLERGGFDVFVARPALRPSDVPALLWRAIRWTER